MRRCLMVLAIGVLWAQAASAQQVSDDDYGPVESVFQEHGPHYGSRCDLQQEAEEFDALMSQAFDIHQEGGKNVDASCLEEVGRRKSQLTWRGLFAEPTWLERYEPEPPLQFLDGCPCLEILNHLSFFDVLDPATVGPYWEPWKMPVYLGHQRWEGDEYREIY